MASPPLPAGKVVEVLDTSTSRVYAHLHTLLLLAIVPVSWASLVAAPVSTLLHLAPTTLVLQALYCAVCLPQTGQPTTSTTTTTVTATTTTTTTPSPPHSKPKAPRPNKSGHNKTARAVTATALLSLVLTFFLAAPLLCIIALLFGAPLVSHQPHTALLAVHLALLTTPHLFYVHGLDATAWLRLASLQQPYDEVYGLSLGACAGAWLGAIPIPLDWDREWQKWPVTIVCGMYAGAVVGKLAGGYLLKGFKMKML